MAFFQSLKKRKRGNKTMSWNRLVASNAVDAINCGEVILVQLLYTLGCYATPHYYSGDVGGEAWWTPSPSVALFLRHMAIPCNCSYWIPNLPDSEENARKGVSDVK
jgi:hypothetical protein